MLQGLRAGWNAKSPTWDAAPSKRMLDSPRADAIMGATIERIAGTAGFCRLRARPLPHPKLGEPGILIAGHLDTVHPVGTIEKLQVAARRQQVLRPGIFDMKGGNYLTLEAIRQLARASFTTPLPITVLFTPTRKSVRPRPRHHRGRSRAQQICAGAGARPRRQRRRHRTLRDRRASISKRSASRATPAPRFPPGRSAIREMARQIIAIDGMTSEDCTFSVGIVHGGQWVNCVATTCTGEALSMAKRQADLDRGVERMLALSGTANDVAFKVTRGVTRPVWEPDAGTMALYEKALGVAKQMGLELPHASAGGGSDGNFTGAMGIPTLDGLGVRGADAHTLNEHIEVDSLAERGRLMAGLLATLE
jgi:glutamate carboxypeptidase